MCFSGGGSRSAAMARGTALQRHGNTTTEFDKVTDFGAPQSVSKFVKQTEPPTITNPWGGGQIAQTKSPVINNPWGGTGLAKAASGPAQIVAPAANPGTISLQGATPQGYTKVTQVVKSADEYKAFTGQDYTGGTTRYVGKTVNGTQNRLAIGDVGKVRRQNRAALSNSSTVSGNSIAKAKRGGSLRIDTSGVNTGSGSSGVGFG